MSKVKKFFDVFKHSVLQHKSINTNYLDNYGFIFNKNINFNSFNDQIKQDDLLNKNYLDEIYLKAVDSVDESIFNKTYDDTPISYKTDSNKFTSNNNTTSKGIFPFQIQKGFSSNNKGNGQSKKDDKKSIYAGGDFEDLVTKSSAFVDKSLFIKEIVEEDSKVILITMPRRWGKSLNLDMLKRFLSVEEGNIKNQELNQKLFSSGEINLSGIKGKKEIPISNIAKEEGYLKLEQGQYPVIAIDFKDCKGSSYNVINDKLKNTITNAFKTCLYLADSKKLSRDEIKLFNKYSDLSKTEDLSEKEVSISLKFLSSLLHTHHGKKVWILIDEYDAAANKAYLEFSTGEAKQVSELFRSILEPTFKGNEYLEKGVMTGVQYILKSGMLSGLNNLSKYNAASTKYSKYYGVNQDEMNLLLEHFEINTEKSAKIKDWYNGYQSNIGTAEKPEFQDKYNIWSIVKYLNYQDDGFKSYWENNSLGAVINKKILLNPSIKDIIEKLVNNIPLTLSNLINDFSVDDFETLKSIINNHDQIEIKQTGIDLLFSYLVITGYLTNTLEANNYIIPNKEIKTEFESKLRDYYSEIFNISPSKFNALTKELNSIFNQKDVQKISSILRENFAPKFSSLVSELKLYNKDSEQVKGAFANEDLMHSLLNNVAIQVVNAQFASERYTTKPNDKPGRADIVLSKNKNGVVIEMKYNKSLVGDGDMKFKDQAKEALEQAISYSKLVKDDDIRIFIGCNITDKQEVFLSGEIQVDGSEPLTFEYP
jgi:hypothetical protein